MAFGDRGRYKSLATAFYSLLPELSPRIDSFPQAAHVPGFPSEAVVIEPMNGVSQLVWLDNGTWKSWLIVEDRGTGSRTLDAGDGPGKAELPARWALGLTLKFYDEWLESDAAAEAERAARDQVSLSRVLVEDLSAKVRRVVLS